ncbi:MAG: hypothetical protein M0P31_11375 [Solirubrobacteraceae bacterium]|nr:hypothetical protein [Solirubrobacteraceae bacterium]
MTKHRTTMAALATTTITALALTPASPASAKVAKGLQDQDMTVNHPGLRATFLTEAQSAKVSMTRFNTRWDGRATEPSLEQVVGIQATANAARAHGITSMVIAPYANSADWNPRGRKKGPTAASKLSRTRYKKYIRSLATSLKDLPITKYYAPINEPNWYRNMPKRGGAAHYRRLHNIAYDEIKKVDKKAKVLFGELAPYGRKRTKNYPHGQSIDPGDFVRDVLGLKSNWKPKRGTKRSTYRIKADGVSLHTYDFKANPNKKRKDRDQWTQANLGYAKSDLRKAARTKRISSSAVKRIYLTEFAYKNAGSDRISESRARTYLKRAWKIAEKQKARAFIWYQLRDPQSDDEIWRSGLQEKDGTPRKAWSTFRGLK